MDAARSGPDPGEKMKTEASRRSAPRSGRRRAVSALALACVAAAVLSGCSGDPQRTGPGAPSLDEEAVWNEPNPVAWTSEEELIGPVLVADGVALAYVHTGRGLVGLVARDAATGQELWSAESVTGTDFPERPFRVAANTIEGRATVAYLAREGSGPSESVPVVVDARSGERIASGQPGRHPRPVACDDGYCLGALPHATGLRVLRYDPASGRFAPSGREAPGGSGVALGDYTFETAGEDEFDLSVGYARDGEVLWTRGFREMFGSLLGSFRGAFEDSWLDDDERYPIVGTARQIWDVTGVDAEIPYDYAEHRMGGFDRRTGGTLWTLEGVGPCPAAAGLTASGEVVVACRFNSGVHTIQWRNREVVGESYENFDVELVGVDRTTGEIRWELPIDAKQPDVVTNTGDANTVSHPERPLVHLDGAAHLVDPASGAIRPLPLTGLLCLEPFEWNGDSRVRLLSGWAQGRMWPYTVVRTRSVCTADGSEVPGGGPSTAGLLLAGFKPGGPYVVAGPEGMIAFAPPAQTG
ncbi:MAG: PQQ-binding-like beta-propeller repeat protein [Pseudoclavibacter sp.]|nr:PQQ-binding-like beta-propeller repeat protein [Pseudoclavibacter sp.]